MSEIIVTGNVIGDLYTLNLLRKKQITPVFSFRNCENLLCIPILVNTEYYVLLNTGINPFCKSPISLDSKLLISGTNHYWGTILEKNSIDISEDTRFSQEIMNDLLKRNKGIVTIPLYGHLNQYYYISQKSHTVDEVDDARLILDESYVDTFMKLPVMNFKNFVKKCPTIVIPKIWEFMKLLAKSQNGVFIIDLISNNIEMSQSLFIILLFNGRVFRHPSFGNEEIFFLYFFELDDLPLNNNDKNRIDTALYQKIKRSYDVFVQKFFKIEYEMFTMETMNKIDMIKSGNNIIFNGEPEFNLFIFDIISGKLLVNHCVIKNQEGSILSGKIIIEVYPNKFDIDVKFKIESFSMRKKIDRIPEEKTIITEVLEEKWAKLIEDEEKEKEISEQKKLIKHQKKSPKTESDAKHLNKMKIIAKNIAIEARSYIDRIRNKKFHEEKKHIEKMKPIAKLLAMEAVEYITKKNTKISNDNIYCEINSDEYNRRIKEWDLKKINPKIFCMPIDKVAELFQETQSRTDIWLFDLWGKIS